MLLLPGAFMFSADSFSKVNKIVQFACKIHSPVFKFLIIFYLLVSDGEHPS